MIVAIAGKSCTGKTTVGRSLAAYLGCVFFSAGEYFRQNIRPKLLDYCLVDRLVDLQLKKIISSGEDYVIEGRATAILLDEHMQENSEAEGTSILISASLDERVARLIDRKGPVAEEKARRLLKRKDRRDYTRLHAKYSRDVFDANLYDISLDTSRLGKVQVFNILKNYVEEIT